MHLDFSTIQAIAYSIDFLILACFCIQAMHSKLAEGMRFCFIRFGMHILLLYISRFTLVLFRLTGTLQSNDAYYYLLGKNMYLSWDK